MMDISKLKERADKLIGGLQIQSRKKRGIGTLACIVYDVRSGKPLGLTNKHILKKRRGFRVIQPANRKRSNEFVIGNILRKGGKGRVNDFAVFEINTSNRSIDTENSIYGLRGKIREAEDAREGLKVQKVGQKTGHTFGIVTSVTKYTITISPNPDKPSLEISDGGDSGCMWVTDEKEFKAVCLHRAGERFDNPSLKDLAYGIPIKRVLKFLNVSLTPI